MDHDYRQALVGELKRQLGAVEADLRIRSDDPEAPWSQSLRAEYNLARERGRTALTWSEWRDGEVALAGVAWVLAAVFVRFCEDNRLLDKVWIAGDGARMHQAVDAETGFYQADPSRNSRDWLRDAFTHLADYPATRGLVDPAHSPVWTAPLGADACSQILSFWRQQSADGTLTWSLVDPDWDSRFLGDLYQDLSVFAKKKYALLQTPHFVEEFILDRTLTPALAEVPLPELKMIDPTCGSGHFLLGAFTRILDAWHLEAPAMDARTRVQKALEAVNGVDLNPFAAAIARFRLALAALKASGVTSLNDAPSFRYRIAIGDSLLAGAPRQGVLDLGDEDELSAHTYTAEDVDEYPNILERRSYHVVVGNPPYIRVNDPALNQAYRDLYSTCYRQYALSVPFMELFFDLAIRGNGEPAGWVGQITSNSFMKREFGSKLIEDMLSGIDPLNPVDLVDVIDTSGAYIPDHGTPTVILIARRRRPVGETVHAVLGVRGEPGQPVDPRRGLVWSEIVDHIDDTDGHDGDYVTITDLPRGTLAHHPWSLSGGGSGGVMAAVEAACGSRLLERMDSIGFVAITRADQAYFAPAGAWQRFGVPSANCVEMVEGLSLRDFTVTHSTDALFPYDSALRPVPETALTRILWLTKQDLIRRREPNGSQLEIGLTWYEWSRFIRERYRSRLLLSFAFVATHNHFVLDRGGKVFNRSAPVIKLEAGATEDDHLGLLGVLNSSTAGFWLKQVSHNKGSTVDTRGARQTQVPWEDFYEFTGTKLQEFPLPEGLPVGYGRRLDALAAELSAVMPAAVLRAGTPSRQGLDDAHVEYDLTRVRMISMQEELDWYTYWLYGLIDEDLTVSGGDWAPDLADEVPDVILGQRAFEIVLARRMADGVESSEWFNRHGSTPVTELPDVWQEKYRRLVQRRLDAIEAALAIRLLERPEFKRRWAAESWESMESAALTAYVLDRLESPGLWSLAAGPRVLSVAQLADLVRKDEEILAALRLLHGSTDIDLTRALTVLLADEAVPFLAAWRYKPSGLRKRAEWESVWDLQRREDAGEKLSIPVPPKYGQADFRKPSYWRARGKLDVPKERFISYPGAEADNDPTPVLGWAGWDHGEQAQALAGLLVQRISQGWDGDRLVPLLAGLVELEPWLHQWFDEVNPDYGDSIATDVTALLNQRLTAAGITRAEASAWAPPETTRGRRRTT